MLPCLPQTDVNLTSPPQPVTCSGTVDGMTINSAFPNAPFQIENYIAPGDTTCPAPGVFAANGVAKGAGLPGGCTRDLVHRFYNEQYQIDGGKQDRYVAGSDAAGLTMGHYDTQGAAHLSLPALSGRTPLRDRRQLLPVRLRRILPQPPVVDRGQDAGLPERARRLRRQRPALDRRAGRIPGGDPAAPGDAGHEGCRAHPGGDRGRVVRGSAERSDPAGRDRVRRLRREHHSAGVPAICARNADREAVAAADRADDRRSPQRRRRRLGLVLRRMVERRR